MIGAAEHRALPSLRVHAQLDIHAVAVEHAEAVPDPVVPAVRNGNGCDWQHNKDGVDEKLAVQK